MASTPPNRHVFSFQSAARLNGAADFSRGTFFSESCGIGNGNMTVGSSIGPGGASSSGSHLDPVAAAAMKQQQQQDYDLSPEWTIEEQKILKQGLVRYATERSMMKYIKIAAMLRRKTVRDVALRCRWLAEKMVDSCSKANTRVVPPSNPLSFSPTMHQVNENVQFSCEVPVLDGASQQLMEENIRMLHQISSNLETYKIQENVDLFYHLRNNITMVLNNMSNMPGIMSRMLPLPVLVNEELLNVILPCANQAFIFGSNGTGNGIH